MRVRFWVLLAAAAVAVAAVGCTGRVARGPQNTPVPTKTLRPTFTVTVPKPTLTPSPAAGEQAGSQSEGAQVTKPTAEPPSPTAPPPTEAPSPTPEEAAFVVSSATINVRSGPGTTFPVLGRLNQGQSFPIRGKSSDGKWWEFDYNGKQGWVIGTNVTAKGADAVEVAQNIPQPPTAAPRPTARPAAAQPARPAQSQPQPQPQSGLKFAMTGKNQLRSNTNPVVSVWCFVLNSAGNGLVPGAMRVLKDGSVIKEQAYTSFMARGDSGYSSEYLYNDGCKVEVPAADGTYSAYLIEGGNQVSDVFNFTVSGESNRTAIVEWKQR